MSLWRVVVLLNAALVAGIVIGYVWRDRAVEQPRVDAPAPLPLAGTWDAEGVVRAVLPDRDLIVITHAPIGGLMPSMTMGFPVSSREVLAGIEIGDEIRFSVQGAPPSLVVTSIRKRE